ncbi:transglycosylase domain-containing protein, partial [Bacillus thuringiensis]|uniref:transglycosylase domain-containing protein n=1 Tax=Bacillus thuringiensis TaxID=1428 RepID=UPI001642E9F9
FTHKFNQLAISLQLQQKYTNQQILQIYINHIYFPHPPYPIQPPPNFYFNKNLEHLTLHEPAILPRLPNSPNR